MRRKMTSDEVSRAVKQVDAKLYNLLGAYLNDGMDTAAKRRFQRWFTLQRHEMFGETLEVKKAVYEKG